MKVLRTEWLKIKSYPAFWGIMIMTALSYPGINYIFWGIYKDITTRKNQAGQIAKLLLGNPFAYPETFHTTAYFSSFFVFIPAIVVIMLVTNEYTYKTHRQNIIDGWSRNQFLLSKFFDVLIITLMVTVLYLSIAIVIGIIASPNSKISMWSNFDYVGYFALQTFSQLSIAFMVGFLVRRSFIALGIFVFYYIIVENMIVGYSKFKLDDIGRFMPLEIADRMIPVPAFLGKMDEKAYNASLANIPQQILLTFVVIAVVWSICYYTNKKRDL